MFLKMGMNPVKGRWRVTIQGIDPLLTVNSSSTHELLDSASNLLHLYYNDQQQLPCFT